MCELFDTIGMTHAANTETAISLDIIAVAAALLLPLMLMMLTMSLSTSSFHVVSTACLLQYWCSGSHAFAVFGPREDTL